MQKSREKTHSQKTLTRSSLQYQYVACMYVCMYKGSRAKNTFQ